VFLFAVFDVLFGRDFCRALSSLLVVLTDFLPVFRWAKDAKTFFVRLLASFVVFRRLSPTFAVFGVIEHFPIRIAVNAETATRPLPYLRFHECPGKK